MPKLLFQPVKTRQILNKLKAANITGIVHEFASLLFEGEADMKIVVDIMLDKIGLKPSLATRYANLVLAKFIDIIF